MLWVAAGYAGHTLENARAGRWVVALVDGLIWMVAVALCVWSVRQAAWKSRRSGAA